MGPHQVIAGFPRLAGRSARAPRSLGPLLVIALLALAALCPSARATTINVPKDQPTIQAGINAAQNGDTVLVAPGTYYENIDFKGKAITVTSSGGPTVTIIDGGNKPGVATVVFAHGETSASVISGFTIRGGGDVTYDGTSNGGVWVRGASPTIQGNTITANYCHNIDVEFGVAATIINNEISGVLSAGPGSYCTFGSGIFLGGAPYDPYYGPGSVIIGNTIENNLNGSGINLWAAVNALIMNNTIRNNTSLGSGSAYVSANSYGIVLIQNLIYGNTSYCGGALAPTEGGSSASHPTVLIANNTIVDNVTDTPLTGMGCITIAQIDPGAYSYGVSGPGLVIVNNIISGSTPYPAVNCSWYSTPNEANQPTFQNNILYNAGGPFFGSYCVDVSSKYGNVAADPQFVNPSAHDYHLKSSSPAIDTGQNSTLQTLQSLTGQDWIEDFDGKPRIQDATGKGCIVDMGAYEFPGTPCGISETLTTSLNPAFAGQTVTFTAQLTAASGTPTGSIQFLDGANLLATQTVSATGSASFTTSSLAVGSHTIAANYQPTGTFGASSASLVQVINGYPTTTALNSSLNPATLGQNVTFTATATGSPLANPNSPTGSVVFADGPTTLATVPLTGNTAAYTTSILSAGAHAITATYSPTGSFAGSSASLTETINGAPTTTALISNSNPAYALQAVTLSATVSTAAGTPTGAVTFMDGASTLGSTPLSASGTATLTVTFPAPGNHSIQAVYSGDSSFNGSTGALTQSVLIDTTATALLAAPAAPGAFTRVTLTATVTSATAAQYAPGAVPAGAIVFDDGATPLGIATLGATGAASLVVSSFPAGTHSLTAAYAGNQSFQASTSPISTLPVAPDATLTGLTGTPDPAALGATVSFTAVVASPATTVIPTGAVTFYDGPSAIGTATLDAQGHAVFTTSALAIGAHSITASYAGDANFTASLSSAFQETITPFTGDFTLSATPAAFALYTGQSVSATVTAAAQGGFHYDLSLACSGLPAGSVCQFSSPTIAGGNGQIGLTIATAAPSAVAARTPPRWRAPSLTALAFLLFVVVPRRRWRAFLAFAAIAFCLGTFTGCGSPGPLAPGTQPGTYTVVITAQAANSGQVLAHSTTINLTVKSLF